jgi:GNAT superfamily N-acetyltransferase
MSANITLRAGRPGDAPAAGAICYHAFAAISNHHGFPPDFPNVDVATGLIAELLVDADVHAVIAESDRRVVGSNFLWEHAAIAGVGPITVDPTVQNAQVGRTLMNHVLERARKRGFAGVRLVQAAYHQRSLSLYTKLGFDAREPLVTMQGEPIRRSIPGFPVRAARTDDVAGCNQLAMRVHGFERGKELSGAIQRGTATVVEREGRITGYATLVGFLGHAVAESNDDLEALIAAAPAFPGPGLLLPMRNAEVFRWCLANGLRAVQPLTLMSLGLYNEPQGAFLPSILF